MTYGFLIDKNDLILLAFNINQFKKIFTMQDIVQNILILPGYSDPISSRQYMLKSSSCNGFLAVFSIFFNY